MVYFLRLWTGWHVSGTLPKIWPRVAHKCWKIKHDFSQVMTSGDLQFGGHTNLAQVQDSTRLFHVVGALSTSGIKRENSEKVGEVVWGWCLESLNARLRGWAFIHYRWWKVTEDGCHLDPRITRTTNRNYQARKGKQRRAQRHKGPEVRFQRKAKLQSQVNLY